MELVRKWLHHPGYLEILKQYPAGLLQTQEHAFLYQTAQYVRLFQEKRQVQ